MAIKHHVISVIIFHVREPQHLVSFEGQEVIECLSGLNKYVFSDANNAFLIVTSRKILFHSMIINLHTMSLIFICL